MASRKCLEATKPSLLWEEQKDLAATGVRIVQVGWSVCAFGILFGGLLALAAHPIMGVLLTLAGMALLLFAAAALCGASVRKQL